MGRRRLWIIATGLMVAVAFVAVLLLYPSAPFQFLDGKPYFGEPRVIVDNLMGGPPAFETNWAFQADWHSFIAKAEQELLQEGWLKDKAASGPSDLEVLGGAEVHRYRRTGESISFYRDAEPPMMAASDLIMVGRRRRGFIGVSHYDANYRPGPLERFRAMFGL